MTAQSWKGVAVRLAWCAVGALVLLGAATLRVVLDGRAELAASDAAWRTGDALGATVHARSAARAYVPLAPHVPAAYRRLRAIAQDCEGRGDVESALFAWRAIRAAAIGSRSIFTAHDRQRQVADEAIVRLSTSTRGRSPPSDRATDAASIPSALAADPPPRAAWAALIVVGAALWVAAGYRLTAALGEDKAKKDGLRMRVPVVLAAAGLAAWWLALYMI
jgi:hypothetical protein